MVLQHRSSLPLLDLYLAHAFIPYPAVWGSLAAKGADRELAEATWMRMVNALPSNTAAYSEAFGPPSEERDGSYLWSLTLWPDHQWVIGFQDSLAHLGPRAPLGVCEIARLRHGHGSPSRPRRLRALRRLVAMGLVGIRRP